VSRVSEFVRRRELPNSCDCPADAVLTPIGRNADCLLSRNVMLMDCFSLLLVSYLGFRVHQIDKAIWRPLFPPALPT